jgi:hypothetical protein
MFQKDMGIQGSKEYDILNPSQVNSMYSSCIDDEGVVVTTVPNKDADAKAKVDLDIIISDVKPQDDEKKESINNNVPVVVESPPPLPPTTMSTEVMIPKITPTYLTLQTTDFPVPELPRELCLLWNEEILFSGQDLLDIIAMHKPPSISTFKATIDPDQYFVRGLVYAYPTPIVSWVDERFPDTPLWKIREIRCRGKGMTLKNTKLFEVLSRHALSWLPMWLDGIYGASYDEWFKLHTTNQYNRVIENKRDYDLSDGKYQTSPYSGMYILAQQVMDPITFQAAIQKYQTQLEKDQYNVTKYAFK